MTENEWKREREGCGIGTTDISLGVAAVSGNFRLPG